MNRFELLNLLQNTIQDEFVICNIGLPSQELYKINDRPNYFYMLGSMGLASSIALGVAIKNPKKHVYVFYYRMLVCLKHMFYITKHSFSQLRSLPRCRRGGPAGAGR